MSIQFSNELDRFLITLHADIADVLEEIWSSEATVRYNSRLEETFKNNHELLFIIKKKISRIVTGKDKELLYEIIRLLSIKFPRYKLYLEELKIQYRIDGYKSIRISLFETLTDSLFVYEFERNFIDNKRRRNFYRRIGSFSREKLKLSNFLNKYFFFEIFEYNPRKPKKGQRIKGYRDHGSLGSEFSKTLKQQSTDWSIREEQLRKKKEEEQLLAFLREFII